MPSRVGRSNLGYGSGSRSSISGQESHGMYSSRQGTGYGGGSYGGSDVGGMYSSSYGGDYVSRGSDVIFPLAAAHIRQCILAEILADAMGLGKTVMTIALILSNPGRVKSEDSNAESLYDNIFSTKRRNINNVEGGTLIVCPMALLGQWKDELETHSKSGSISIFVHYGGGRTDNVDLLLEYDVVLTTYGVLSASYKSDGENSIYHRVQWFRVVLDEAHHIKAHKSQVAQATIALSSHCRWCLTGTPLQNSISSSHSIQSHGYIDEVLGHIQKGETVECSICLESPEDPVFTPCAHQFCRECLFNCWGTSMGGKCPICRQSLKKNDLIVLPSESPFKVDTENNLTESSKVSRLFDFLEHIQKYSDEKSIVFSQWNSFFDLLDTLLKFILTLVMYRFLKFKMN
ncbi:hypothetical protein KIW84_023228 [Lathyrus oleraceus]|uniref:Uncharacterized protein n=1 Tax=Pisum sativum TaxID=3888 RepID=A0A9D5AKR1_PEA|nr:hypothetical protein KIW84_053929 [Pisum sativum]KAI5412463.1 hypothetical protein KIW84_057221 [Pisum sativum]KAI5437029.1 hypothetical protein KIW84_023228 [Pisum sativum]